MTPSPDDAARVRPAARSRAAVAVALVVTVALGLLSRRFPLPGLLAEYPGDALYAVAAFLAFALLRPRASTAALAALGLGFAAAVECSQLLTWPWLEALRRHRLAALLLGQGFQWADLVSYAAGIAAVATLDVICRARKGLRP